jgi:hypothetical protein
MWAQKRELRWYDGVKAARGRAGLGRRLSGLWGLLLKEKRRKKRRRKRASAAAEAAGGSVSVPVPMPVQG